MTETVKIAIGSIIVGVVVLALKTLAWQMTGSVALMSDALESTVNVVTAIAALMAIRVAARPADSNHPYGHHKAEFFSAVLEGVMIIIAALLILRQAGLTLMHPEVLDAPLEGLLVNIGGSFLNGIWCWVLIRRGRALRSPALVADGKHLLTDVWSSFGVVVGVLLAVSTGWSILDPLLAIAVAINILWAGMRVMSHSLSGLMDEAVDGEQLEKIREVISRAAEGAIEVHDLRTRHAGPKTFIDFHLVVDGQTTVNAAHDICDQIEKALHACLPDTQVTIHVEPEEKAKHSGVLVL